MRFPGHDAATPADDSGRLVVELGRLLCDYGPSASCRDGMGETQASRGVDGRPATGLDATSRMRQIHCLEVLRGRRDGGEWHMNLSTFVDKGGGRHLCRGQILPN